MPLAAAISFGIACFSSIAEAVIPSHPDSFTLNVDTGISATASGVIANTHVDTADDSYTTTVRKVGDGILVLSGSNTFTSGFFMFLKPILGHVSFERKKPKRIYSSEAKSKASASYLRACLQARSNRKVVWT